MITIISILASLVVGIAMLAAQTGREGKTRNMVERIHTLLVDQYNSFKTRRIELNPAVTQAISNLTSNATGADRGKITAAARLFALREMMMLEMPDRWSDLVFDIAGNMPKSPAYLAQRTALSDAFLRRFQALLTRTNSITGMVNTTQEILANQSAECLYMVVTMACGDGEARTQFHENDIGDTDGDGAPEFLDAWDHPISFIRWPVGFDSLIEINANTFGTPSSPNLVDWEAAAAKDHDPFDVFRLQPKAFRLVPLVYSAGRDEKLGIDQNVDYVPWRRLPIIPITITGSVYPYFNQPLDPYIAVTSGPGAGTYLGSEDFNNPGESTDNIHNHSIGRRL